MKCDLKKKFWSHRTSKIFCNYIPGNEWQVNRPTLEPKGRFRLESKGRFRLESTLHHLHYSCISHSSLLLEYFPFFASLRVLFILPLLHSYDQKYFFQTFLTHHLSMKCLLLSNVFLCYEMSPSAMKCLLLH